MRRATRTRYSLWPPPSMATSPPRRSGWLPSPRAARVSRRLLSTRSAASCIASSRRAVRLAGEKNACSACVACSGT
ncbi:hypothetical protein G6F54_014107 [Rhizopus delemar]|nr:hypothetical protein G6F54_014107 [Rhizopus delemar]